MAKPEYTAAIRALGGTHAVAQLFDIDPKVVFNWHRRGLPADTYYELAPRLKRQGFDFAPDRLFGQRLAKTD